MIPSKIRTSGARRVALGIVFLSLVCGAFAQVSLDLTSTNGSLVPSAGWTYNGAWYADGQFLGATATLTTPAYTVGSNGAVTGSFTHRFSYETRGDGGQIQYRVGTGVWNTIPGNLITGASYNDALDLGSGSTIINQYAFTGESINYASGYVTSSFTFGSGTSPFQTGSGAIFSAGDQIQFRFLAAWDASSISQNPNWQVTAVSFTNASTIPEPSTYAALAGLGSAVFVVISRRRTARLARQSEIELSGA